ncbi:MAG: AmmeMemoRadiSam system protein B [Planctomycetes bacterium]|nr:AmmeMemoRadiSam system protein B [Planctomycetota bacterium]
MGATQIRQPARAGSFYPASSAACAEEIAELRRQAPSLSAELSGKAIFGGLVPHAGWAYSGPTALAVFEALKQAKTKPETVVIFATAHRPDVHAPSLQSEGKWRVPGGEAEIDANLARAMLDQGRGQIVDHARAHEGDHAIEVQLPFLMDALPGARFVPVAMPFGEFGPGVGRIAADAAQKIGRKIAAVASVDLTHYGPNYYDFAPQGVGMKAHRWSKEVNDRRFLERVLALDAPGAYAAGEEDKSCCGPAAAAAAIAASHALGAAKGVLLEHVTSWERGKKGEPCDFVGYAGVVFV